MLINFTVHLSQPLMISNRNALIIKPTSQMIMKILIIYCQEN
ncbi:hypothetical protein PEC302107_30410 [Pectobacterium araliae]|nr:hypothetical protein PEC302107_30410 [Pectobacterium carotovorum subsp. carotovorum]